MNVQLQKEVVSTYTKTAKVCSPKSLGEIICETKGGGQEMAVMVKIIATIQVNLVPNPSETLRRTHKFT